MIFDGAVAGVDGPLALGDEFVFGKVEPADHAVGGDLGAVLAEELSDGSTPGLTKDVPNAVVDDGDSEDAEAAYAVVLGLVEEVTA